MLVEYYRKRGTPLTPEQIAEIEKAAKYPNVFDEDCPEMTEEQLCQFRLTRSLTPRPPLTPEEIAEIEARAPRDEDIVYDEDSPEMTEEQLRQFRRVNPRPTGGEPLRNFG